MKKNALKIVAVLVGVAGVFLIYKYIKGKKDMVNNIIPPIVPSPNIPPVTPPTSSSSSNDKYPLAKGSRGYNVKLLQKALKAGLTEDGIFGSKTEAALVAKTGKKSVASQKELEAIASSNGFGFKTDSSGRLTLVPKAEQNIIYQGSGTTNTLPLFGS